MTSKEGETMPVYDLHCTLCDADFRLQASMTDKREKRVACPQCGSHDLDTVFKPIPYHIKGDKPAECPNSHICGAGCHHTRGVS